MTNSYEADVFVGEYRVEGVIGHGGMGVVYAAVHPVIGKRAAIKILRHDQCSSPIAVERFVDEARIVNTIGHPNIVDIFAIGMLPDGRSYLVMELLDGETLHDRITRGPLAVVEVIDIVRQLARALDAAHVAGVVHRDLKPDNVFLVQSGLDVPAVKLLDFGIAKLANNDHRANHTATGSVMGTPMYLSPEQANGAGIDRRADIYALGCIMFEMLTGRAPFIGDSALEIITKHVMDSPVRPSTFAPHIPVELDELVFAMLAKNPSARPSLLLVQSALSQITGLARGSSRAVVPTAMWGGPGRAFTPPFAPRTVKGTPPPPLAQSHDAPTIMMASPLSSSSTEMRPANSRSLIPTPRSLTPSASLRRMPKRSPIWFVLAMAIALGTIAFALAYWISAGTG